MQIVWVTILFHECDSVDSNEDGITAVRRLTQGIRFWEMDLAFLSNHWCFSRTKPSALFIVHTAKQCNAFYVSSIFIPFSLLLPTYQRFQHAYSTQTTSISKHPSFLLSPSILSPSHSYSLIPLLIPKSTTIPSSLPSFPFNSPHFTGIISTSKPNASTHSQNSPFSIPKIPPISAISSSQTRSFVQIMHMSVKLFILLLSVVACYEKASGCSHELCHA